MSDSSSKALLPDGLRDALPPDAAHEAAIIERLMQVVGSRGYERVEPPLVEFEDSLLGGAGQDVALATFRLMDPVSQRMMGLRADMTPQALGLPQRVLPMQHARCGWRMRGRFCGSAGTNCDRNGSSMKLGSNCSARNKRKPISKLSRWPRTRLWQLALPTYRSI